LKKLNVALFSTMFLLLTLVGCNNEENKVSKSEKQKHTPSIQEISFKSLSLNEKNELADKREKGIVQRTVVTKRMAYLKDDKYYGRKVYSVTFKSTNPILGDIVVFVDGNKKSVIGKGYRE
jgi:hypothetical protein